MAAAPHPCRDGSGTASWMGTFRNVTSRNDECARLNRLEDSMLVKLINPNTTTSMTEAMRIAACSVAAQGTRIVAATSRSGVNEVRPFIRTTAVRASRRAAIGWSSNELTPR